MVSDDEAVDTDSQVVKGIWKVESSFKDALSTSDALTREIVSTISCNVAFDMSSDVLIASEVMKEAWEARGSEGIWGSSKIAISGAGRWWVISMRHDVIIKWLWAKREGSDDTCAVVSQLRTEFEKRAETSQKGSMDVDSVLRRCTEGFRWVVSARQTEARWQWGERGLQYGLVVGA